MSRKTYVYDKLTGKVVEEHKRTDKPRSAYITKTFPGDGIRNAQLANSPWDNSPAAHFTSFRDLESKAAARGMVVNYSAD